MQVNSFEDRIKSWLQIFALLGAALWAIYTFVYQENIKPKHLPSHIISNLELSSIGVNNSRIGIKADITIENISQRKIIVLPSSFVAWGAKTELSDIINKDADIFKTAENIFINTDQDINNYHGLDIKRQAVASGAILKSYIFEPGEKIKKTIVFFVPKNEYEFIDMNCYFPISDDDLGIYNAEWNLFKNSDAYEVSFKRRDKNTRDERIIDSQDKALIHHKFGVIKTNDIFSLIAQKSF